MLNMALRWRFLFASVFVACRGRIGKDRNIPSGETLYADLSRRPGGPITTGVGDFTKLELQLSQNLRSWS
jgi:hypothetical protein